MSKKVARTISYSTGRNPRRRRRVRSHVLKAASNTSVLILVGLPAGIYVLYCLCSLVSGPHIHPVAADWRAPQAGSPWGDRDSMMRQSATEPHPH
jgi:hypothetical protein